MLGALEWSRVPSRWAVIKDARRRQRRRERRTLAVAAVALLAVAVGWVVTRNSSSDSVTPPPPTAVGTVEQLHLGGVVRDTTTLDGHLWVLTCLTHCSQPFSTASAGQLIELAADGRSVKRVSVPDPTALTGGDGALWVAHFAAGGVSRLNPRTGRMTASTDLRFAKPIATHGWRRFEPSAISFGAGRVWASDGFGYVAEIDPRTTRRQRTVFTSSEAASSTTAAGLTWVADELEGVGTFPAGSARVAIHHVSWAGQPVDIATVAHGAGLIWAVGTETSFSRSLTHPTTIGVVTTLDPQTGRVAHQWRVSPPASALVLGTGGAYVSAGNRRLLRLTPPHGLRTLHGPTVARLTAATPGALWAINRRGDLVRIGLTHP